ncbi:MAG: hypothetical protein HY744_11410 [Deltaproteobacteria bacterium]|nr:hypothetical protein [Deltaproteobacteria bacterium]
MTRALLRLVGVTAVAAGLDLGCGDACEPITDLCPEHYFRVELWARKSPLPQDLVVGIAAKNGATKFSRTYAMDDLGLSGELGWCALIRDGHPSDPAVGDDLVLCEWGAGPFYGGAVVGTFDAAGSGVRDVHAELVARSITWEHQCGPPQCFSDYRTLALKRR